MKMQERIKRIEYVRIILEAGMLLLLWKAGLGIVYWGIVVAVAGLEIYQILRIEHPVRQMLDVVEKLKEEEQGEEELREAAWKQPLMWQIERLIEKYAAMRSKRDLARIFDKQTELTALQSQINPHFLYNTLESIRGQAMVDGNTEIAKMVEALAAFFRYSISRKGNLVTLREELANINNYMLIQRYRFCNRFSLEVIIDEEDEVAYDFLIPKLIIQPVVENAIFHGLEERSEGGKVEIEIILTDSNLIITISDNGKGMEGLELQKLNERIWASDSRLEDGKGNTQRNTGIALPNIHKRIQLLFGRTYGVNIYSTAGQGTDVEITIPANYQKE